MISKKLKILPQGRERGDLLPWVIAVMTYLSTLFMAGGFAVSNSASNWSSDISKNMTVQITQSDTEEKARQVEAAIGILKNTPGILDAVALTDQELENLLEPWLGTGNIGDSLPIPAMISVTLAEDAFINIAALQGQLRVEAPDASIDDHQSWLDQLILLANGFEIAAVLTVLLITLATVAIVVFSTKGKLAAHKDNIEIVHLIGAEDHIIAREFNHQFMVFGLKGGFIGLLGTALTIIAGVYLSNSFEAQLFPNLALTPLQMGILVLFPVGTALLTKKTADIAVKNYLEQML